MQIIYLDFINVLININKFMSVSITNIHLLYSVHEL